MGWSKDPGPPLAGKTPAIFIRERYERVKRFC